MVTGKFGGGAFVNMHEYMLTHTHTHACTHTHPLLRASKLKEKKFLLPVAIETICSPDGDKRSKLQRCRVEP